MNNSKSLPINAIAIIGCIVICLASVIMYVTTVNNNNATLDAQSARIAQLRQDIANKSASLQESQSQAVQTTTGLNAARVAQDNAIAQAFLKDVMTWDSWDTYDAIRRRCINEYGLDPESRFMSVFLPAVPTRTSNDGTVYNRIDVEGLNCTYEGTTSYVRGINGTTYSYFATVGWSVTSPEGYEGSATAIFIYSIDVNGDIIDLDAYTLPGRTR